MCRVREGLVWARPRLQANRTLLLLLRVKVGAICSAAAERPAVVEPDLQRLVLAHRRERVQVGALCVCAVRRRARLGGRSVRLRGGVILLHRVLVGGGVATGAPVFRLCLRDGGSRRRARPHCFALNRRRLRHGPCDVLGSGGDLGRRAAPVVRLGCRLLGSRGIACSFHRRRRAGESRLNCDRRRLERSRRGGLARCARHV